MNHETEVLVASRRRLLAIAGCVAVMPAIALAAPGGAPKPAEAPPGVDPYFHELRTEIDLHLTRWMDRNEDCKSRDRTLRRWVEHHPEPAGDCPWKDHSAWMARHQNVMRSLQLASVRGERNAAAKSYHKAVKGFAAMEADSLAELLFKVEVGVMMDSNDNTIGRSVLFDILQLKWEGDFSYRANAAAA